MKVVSACSWDVNIHDLMIWVDMASELDKTRYGTAFELSSNRLSVDLESLHSERILKNYKHRSMVVLYHMRQTSVFPIRTCHAQELRQIWLETGLAALLHVPRD